MSDYTVIMVAELNDRSGDRPGEIRFLKNELGTEQVALTHRIVSAGETAPFPHHHKIQEEVIYVIAGQLEVKIGDVIETLGPKMAVRIGPGTPHGYRSVGSDDAELLIISARNAEPKDDAVFAEGFWPDV